MMTLPMVAMRPRKMSQGLTTAGALAVAAFLALYFPNRDDTGGAIFGAAFAFCASVIGFAAVGRVRPLTRRPLKEQGRLMGLSLIIGSALGLANLIANYSVASLDSRIYIRMSEMYARSSAWSGVFATLYWRRSGFGCFSWAESHGFSVDRPMTAARSFLSPWPFRRWYLRPCILLRPPAGLLDATAVVLKAAAAGLLLGWVFWRWGPISFVLYCVPWRDE